jgi:hypothetical protein
MWWPTSEANRRCSAEANIWMVGILAAVIAVLFTIWATTRPSWWRSKNDVYFGLCGLVLTCAWLAFVAVFRPDMAGVLASFIFALIIAGAAHEILQ